MWKSIFIIYFFCPDFFVQVANWVDKKAKFNFQDVQTGKQKNITALSTMLS